MILPQFHGREHVNVELWITLLQSKDSNFLSAFNEGISGLSLATVPYINKDMQARKLFDFLEELNADDIHLNRFYDTG